MRSLHDRFGTRIFIFQDDDVSMRSTRHRAWIDEFLSELERASLAGRIVWRMSCRVDDLDLDVIRRMREHGLATIFIGIEGGSDSELKTINKGYKADSAYRAIDILHESGVLFDFGFMLLTPDSSTC